MGVIASKRHLDISGPLTTLLKCAGDNLSINHKAFVNSVEKPICIRDLLDLPHTYSGKYGKIRQECLAEICRIEFTLRNLAAKIISIKGCHFSACRNVDEQIETFILPQ